jgi:hypothetical protein
VIGWVEDLARFLKIEINSKRHIGGRQRKVIVIRRARVLLQTKRHLLSARPSCFSADASLLHFCSTWTRPIFECGTPTVSFLALQMQCGQRRRRQVAPSGRRAPHKLWHIHLTDLKLFVTFIKRH